MVGLALSGLAAGASPAPAAEPCPNEAIRSVQAFGSRLPDCRAYEQVTPVSKDGTNPSGNRSDIQASLTGDRITYLVPAGFPGAQGSATFPNFISGRSGGSWLTQGLLPPANPGTISDTILGWSEDLSEFAVRAKLPAAPGLGLYVHQPGAESYDAVAGPFPETFFLKFTLAGFSSADSSRMYFETRRQLLPQAEPGTLNLYESHGGVLSLVDLLPESEGGSAPLEGGFAGPYAWQEGNTENGGGNAGYYTQSAISSDGSRVFFTAAATGQLYVREDFSQTVKVSASHRAVPDPNGPRPAAFMSATPDGSEVFFTSCEKLTEDSTAVSTIEPSCTGTTEGQDLYSFNTDTGTLTDLTVDHEAGDLLGAAVQGVLGSGVDPGGVPSVYFAANGVLAPGAQPGNCEGVEFNVTEPFHCNLYVSHGSQVRFIAELSSGQDALQPSDADNWYGRPELQAAPGRERQSRVSADGDTLLFTSARKLTSYENAGVVELYRYSLASGEIRCVSCVPSGAPPTAAPTLESIGATSGANTPASILARNLADEGSRVFFETTESLLPADGNRVRDVYEWEAPGVGTCTVISESYSSQSGGCLNLISTGKSPDPSSFADSSASGEDVFLFTSQPLVSQDQDQLVDIYDAHVGGGIPAQNAVAAPGCSDGGCRAVGEPAPPPEAAASARFTGVGNQRPSPSSRAHHLAAALKRCRTKHGSERSRCEAHARRRFGRAPGARKKVASDTSTGTER